MREEGEEVTMTIAQFARMLFWVPNPVIRRQATEPRPIDQDKDVDLRRIVERVREINNTNQPKKKITRKR